MRAGVCALLILGSLAVLMAAYFFRIGAGARPENPLQLGERAATALEFTLVFPIFLMIVFTILQLLLLVNAMQYVSYAAFSAARSAIVLLPPLSSETGAAMPESTQEAMRDVRRSAALACLPISPPLGEFAKASPISLAGASLPEVGSEVALVGALVAAAGLNGPRAASKLLYASSFTDVDIEVPPPSRAVRNADDVTVTVRHRFFLNIPYANRLFRDGGALGFIGAAPQREISASYTLSNDRRREMP